MIDNHMSVLSSFGLSMKDENCDLPWIPKLHKCPYKQRYIAGAAKCSIKPLFKILTSILTAVKTDLHEYHDTCFSRSGVNRMWILKNSKDLLDLSMFVTALKHLISRPYIQNILCSLFLLVLL